jgi:hypothetical protein
MARKANKNVGTVIVANLVADNLTADEKIFREAIHRAITILEIRIDEIQFKAHNDSVDVRSLKEAVRHMSVIMENSNSHG